MKFSNNKFHGYPTSRSRADIYGQTDMTKLIGAFRVDTNAPETRNMYRVLDLKGYYLKVVVSF